MPVLATAFVVAALFGLMVLFVKSGRRGHKSASSDRATRPVRSGAQQRRATDTHARDWAMTGEILLANRLQAPVMIHYRDLKGALTERTVTVQTVGGLRTRDRGTYLTSLQGFCHLRQEVRSFHASGIESTFDARTGEKIKNLGAFFLNRPELILGDPPAPPSKIRSKLADGEPPPA